jgi:Holliday junction resolvase RusA-like endonuclease
MATHTLIIPNFLPARLNTLLGHWGTRSKRKRADRDTIALAALLAGIPRATGPRRVSLVVTLGPRRRADPDCFFKSVCDALTACQLIVDDSSKWLELGPVRIERGKEKSTTIILEDV